MEHDHGLKQFFDGYMKSFDLLDGDSAASHYSAQSFVVKNGDINQIDEAEKSGYFSDLMTSNAEAGDSFGWMARNIGDVDGDGIDDMTTSAPFKTIEGEANAGKAYAYSGGDGRLLWTVDGKPGEQLGRAVGAAASFRVRQT